MWIEGVTHNHTTHTQRVTLVIASRNTSHLVTPRHTVRFVWASGADGAFSVAEDTDMSDVGDLGRGTLIKIHLKEGEEV